MATASLGVFLLLAFWVFAAGHGGVCSSIVAAACYIWGAIKIIWAWTSLQAIAQFIKDLAILLDALKPALNALMIVLEEMCAVEERGRALGVGGAGVGVGGGVGARVGGMGLGGVGVGV
ncbi:hypothetical protein DACRYDRAFT_16305 [Dacryopinax primogenitus]|uniref:Uncharacterized protein n=1 Tax=Dacryopinax primogenitus (strain DJM 731) TaxID=1858805 RepID=M5G4U1_DACPD|nr:uncharacterized protein DACRYDRAFT_16305 [Dacryopinax primogenitus]EJU00877.1 hypothetical protein DACRYDRAFT_16305 [Dacryopinax primogenitus]